MKVDEVDSIPLVTHRRALLARDKGEIIAKLEQELFELTNQRLLEFFSECSPLGCRDSAQTVADHLIGFGRFALESTGLPPHSLEGECGNLAVQLPDGPAAAERFCLVVGAGIRRNRSARAIGCSAWQGKTRNFIRRFLLHALPDGFQRIRFGGFLANCHRTAMMVCIRRLLQMQVTELLPLPHCSAQLRSLLTNQSVDQCPHCRLGRLHRMEVLPPIRWPDTS